MPSTTRNAPGKLVAYRRRRAFGQTPEPQGARTRPAERLRFVVQKHAASHLHYDFRLELNGVLLSWAVPKGPSLDPSVKRLAVHVEDHPIEYADFEGVIPAHQYGAGTVMVWDRGFWEPEGDAAEGYKKGHLAFFLHGAKLKGRWTLVKTALRSGKEPAGRNWLLIKAKDAEARKGDILSDEPRSAASGRAMTELARTAEAVCQDGKAQATGRGKARGRPGADVSRAPGAKRAPMPAAFAPELASRADTPPSGEAWLHEVKFDGYRLVCHRDGRAVRIVTRNGNDWTGKFRGLSRALLNLRCRQAIIDGEVVALTPAGVSSFQALQNAVHQPGGTAHTVFYAFDVPYLDGYDLTGTPLDARKELLRGLLATAPGETAIRFSDHVRGAGEDFLRFACEASQEGVVSKRADSLYRQERTRDWLKVKCTMPTKRKSRPRDRKPERASGRKRDEPRAKAQDQARPGVHGLWSGTLSFGLVSVPVALFPALRRRPVHFKLFAADGTPLMRRYICPADGKVLESDDLVHGYEQAKGKYVLVSDDELASLEPRKSSDINLLEFVDIHQIDPFFYERPYFLAPGGGSYKAYRLLAAVMEKRGKAGIATFVMHDREYLVAIIAEHGLLMAETLRFVDELRTPAQLALSELPQADHRSVNAYAKAIAAASTQRLETTGLKDDYAERLAKLVARKRRAKQAVVQTAEAEEPEPGEAIDLVAVFKQRMKEAA